MRFSIIVISILSGFSLSSQSLEDYLIIAQENNPAVRARLLEFEAAQKKIVQARALPDPSVSAAVFLSPMMLPMGNQLGSISATQMFPWFGTLDAMANEAASMAEVKYQLMLVEQNELAYKVKNAWYPLYELAEHILIQRDLLRVLETDKALATFRFQHGQAPLADAIRADIMIDQVKTEIELLEQKRKPLVITFNRLLNRDDTMEVTPSGGIPEPAKDVYVYGNNAIDNNPMLAVLDKQIRVAIAEEEVAGYMRKPMLGAGLQYMPLTKRNTDDISLPPNTGMDMVMPMVSMTLPIWRKKYDAAVEERQLMQRMYTEMKRDMQNDLVSMYEMSYYDLEKMTQMINLLETQMLKSQQVIDLLLASYGNAGTDFEEILRLQQELYRYRTEKVTAQVNYQLALVKLYYLTGKTTH